MRVLIIGVDHHLQSREGFCTNDEGYRAFLEGQWEHFRNLVSGRIRETGATLVGEEASHKEATFAQRLCEQCALGYANVEMTPEERERRQIPTGYSENPGTSSEQKTAWHRAREDHMIEEFLRNSERHEGAILICGADHASALEAGLRGAGHQVRVMDARQEEWYERDWDPLRELKASASRAD